MAARRIEPVVALVGDAVAVVIDAVAALGARHRGDGGAGHGQRVVGAVQEALPTTTPHARLAGLEEVIEALVVGAVAVIVDAVAGLGHWLAGNGLALRGASIRVTSKRARTPTSADAVEARLIEAGERLVDRVVAVIVLAIADLVDGRAFDGVAARLGAVVGALDDAHSAAGACADVADAAHVREELALVGVAVAVVVQEVAGLGDRRGGRADGLDLLAGADEASDAGQHLALNLRAPLAGAAEAGHVVGQAVAVVVGLIAGLGHGVGGVAADPALRRVTGLPPKAGPHR